MPGCNLVAARTYWFGSSFFKSDSIGAEPVQNRIATKNFGRNRHIYWKQCSKYEKHRAHVWSTTRKTAKKSVAILSRLLSQWPHIFCAFSFAMSVAKSQGWSNKTPYAVGLYPTAHTTAHNKQNIRYGSQLLQGNKNYPLTAKGDIPRPKRKWGSILEFLFTARFFILFI